MGESNNEWGDLASHDQELATAWDGFVRLPVDGEHEVLDRFCDRKHITIRALLKVGARLTEEGGTTLAFAFPGGIKFRDMVTGKRWSYLGSEWRELKVVPHGAERTNSVIVCEGETDGARLSELYDVDVAIMPAGARFFPPTYAEQLAEYDYVFVGLDADEAGADGTAKIAELLPTAIRLMPPAEDWCAWDGDEPPPLVVPDDMVLQQELTLVPAGELVELEVPDVTSWFEHALLPVGGLMVLHGWIKSFKTYLALDMLAALAQGQDWCCFEPSEEATKVAVIQYEIPWPFYQQRVQQLRTHAREPGLFDENFYTYTPLRRPELVAGNKAQEDMVLRTLTDAGVQVVLIDPIRRAGGLIDMNAEHEVRKVLMFFERLQNEGLTVVTTHHDNKESARRGGGDALGMTGSGAWGGDPDTIISIELPRGEDHRTSPRRNLQFTLRNAPAMGGRAMEMGEDGRIVYDTAVWDGAEDDYAPAI